MKPKLIQVGSCVSRAGKITRGELSLASYEESDSRSSGLIAKDIIVPVFIVQGAKDGPTSLFLSGLKGNESIGSAALFDFIEDIAIRDLSGTIIIIPIINPQGYFINSEVHPYDGKNIEESFPGESNGSVSEQVAFNLLNEVVDLADSVVIFSEEDDKLLTMSYVKISSNYTAFEENKPLIDKALSVGTDIILLEQPIEGQIKVEIEEFSGIPAISICVGGFCTDGIEVGISFIKRSIKNYLVQNSQLDSIVDLPKKQFFLRAIGGYYSSNFGTLRTFFSLGDFVEKTDVVAEIINPVTVEKIKIKAGVDGRIFQINEKSRISQGEKVFAIVPVTKNGREFDYKKLSKEAIKVFKN